MTVPRVLPYVHVVQNISCNLIMTQYYAACSKLVSALQAGLADITQSLKNYRPSVTVLEAQVAPSRRGEGAGGTGAPGLTAANGPDGGLVAVMEQKRQAHDQAIQVDIITAAAFKQHCHVQISTPACPHITRVCGHNRSTRTHDAHTRASLYNVCMYADVPCQQKS